MTKLFKYLKPYTSWIILVITLTLIQAFSQLYLPNLMSDIVDKGVVGGDINFIIKTGLIMLGFTLVVSVATIVARLFGAKTGVAFARDLRRKIFVKVESYSLHDFDQIGTSSLITRNTNDVTQVQNVMVMMLTMLIFAPLMLVGGLIMALRTDAPLSWIILVAAGILGIVIGFVASKGLPLFKSIQKKIDKVNLVLRESLTGIRVIRAFNKEKFEETRFEASNADLTDTSIKVFRIMSFLFPALMLIMNMTTVAIVWFGAQRIDSGNMQVGDMMAFQQYAMQIMFSIMMATMMFVMIPRASASAERILEVLDMKNEVLETENPKKATDACGCVSFKNVSFSYKGAEKPVLKNISFDAKPGEMTAIIGSTGSGKTTLINLIPRFYEASEGEVFVDGVNVRQQSKATLRAKVGLVPQKMSLFSGTIRENMQYGKTDATDEEILAALKTAQASEFIDHLEDGLDAHVEQGGANFSGGQKQRLSIARALVRKPEIYVFDDSFSALDFKTDAQLRSALRKEIENATVLLVAQRVSTVMNADRILVLDQGEMAGMGTHKELLKSCDVYKEIVASQLSEEELGNE
ncbi:MAG: ABC transporter ATP-binding protein [Eubacteriales bacterium]